jgi:hypothetical protein
MLVAVDGAAAHPDFQLGQMLVHNGDGGERLQRQSHPGEHVP